MPPQNVPHRRKTSQPRRIRTFAVVLALLVGVVICAAAASAAARLREAAPIRDRASQSLSEAVKTVQLDDTSPPTRPRRLALMKAMPTSVTVSWRRSYDNVGVAGYMVFLLGRPTMRTTGTTYTIESLACSTTYRVGVVAHDASGNESRSTWISVSTAACAPPQPPADTQPPAKPILSLGTATQTTLELRWQAGKDNVGVHHYNVFRGNSAAVGNQVKVAETTALSYVYTGLACGTSYSLALQAQDAAGNKSNLSEAIWYPVTARACDQPPPPPAPPGDTQPPSAPSNLRVTSSTATSIALAWTASTDNVGVAGYDVYLNGVKVWMPSGTSFTYLGLSCATTYTAAVDAYDAAGNHSPKTAVTVATPACPDTTPPSTPTGLAASSATQTSLTLGWKASTDNVGVKGYDVYRNGTKVATVSGTSSDQSGLACDTQYAFAVAALDAAGNASTTAQLNAGTSACTAPASSINPPPPSGAGFLFDQMSDLVPGFFNGARATEISTEHGPGFNFQSPGANQGAECPWDLGLACVLGKWIYPADFMGKTYDWTFYVRFPSAGNPQGFPSNWLTNAFFEVGHTNVSSGHHIALDMVWAQRGSLRWRLGIATNEPTNTWDYSSPGTVVQMDTWYKWRMQIKWSTGSDGFINLWLNDQPVKSYNGHTAPNTAPPALQAGIYSIDDRPLQDQIANLHYVRTG
jgi:chitodextrinase